jgi:hypothetical protein
MWWVDYFSSTPMLKSHRFFHSWTWNYFLWTNRWYHDLYYEIVFMTTCICWKHIQPGLSVVIHEVSTLEPQISLGKIKVQMIYSWGQWHSFRLLAKMKRLIKAIWNLKNLWDIKWNTIFNKRGQLNWLPNISLFIGSSKCSYKPIQQLA